MRDPATDVLIVDPATMKQTALNYCAKLLQNDNFDLEFREEIDTENILHYLRAQESSSYEDSFDFKYLEQRIRL